MHHPRALQLVLDSLRYWVNEMHVDGFRFDARRAWVASPVDFDSFGRFFATVQQDPVLSRVKLIAEPWDLGPRRLPAGRVSAGLGRMEWALPGRRAPLLARRRGTSARAGLATLSGSSDIFQGSDRESPTPASTSSRVTTVSRFETW